MDFVENRSWTTKYPCSYCKNVYLHKHILEQHELQHDFDHINIVCEDIYNKWRKNPRKSFIKSYQSFGKLMKMCKSAMNLISFQATALKNDNKFKKKSAESRTTSSNSCPNCHKIFSRVSSLNRHKSNGHCFAQTGKYKCKLCNNSYQHRPSLHRHFKECHFDTITF